MEAAEEVRSQPGFCCAPRPRLLFLSLLFSVWPPRTSAHALSLSPPFLFPHLSPSGPFHFTLEVAPRGAMDFQDPAPALESLPA